MKRFWKQVTVGPAEEQWTIELDGRPVRTPARSLLSLPSVALAEAIAEEWRAVPETIDPRAMPLTGLANAAIDRIQPDCAEFARDLTKYAEADLACYRAEGPASLVQRQAQLWDPLLAWARRRFDIDFTLTQGLMHVAQPQFTIAQLSSAVHALDAFQLAALSPLTTIGGSLVAALAVLEKAMSAEDAWSAVSLDERWQLEQWGADAEAEAALENRHRDFRSAARFLEMLDA